MIVFKHFQDKKSLDEIFNSSDGPYTKRERDEKLTDMAL